MTRWNVAPKLCCYWVGSLDFNFSGNQGVLNQAPQTAIHFLQRGQPQPRRRPPTVSPAARLSAVCRPSEPRTRGPSSRAPSPRPKRTPRPTSWRLGSGGRLASKSCGVCLLVWGVFCSFCFLFVVCLFGVVDCFLVLFCFAVCLLFVCFWSVRFFVWLVQQEPKGKYDF